MSDILSIVKDQEKELKAQVPSFLQQTANSSPSKLLGDYEKTGNTIFKKAAGQALEFLSTAVQKAKEWTAPKAEALGAGVLFAGMAATPRGRRIMSEEGVNFISNKLKNTWYGSADEIASVLSKPRMYTPDEQLSLFVEHIQPKLEKLKTPRDDQALVFYQPADGVGGQYVNTRLEEVFHYPVDENLKVKVVPLSKLKSTGDDAKDAIGYRILDTTSVLEPIRGKKGLFKGSKSLKNPIENKLSILKKMDGIDARLGVKILETLDKTYDGSNNLMAAKMLQTYFKSDPKFYSEIVKRTSQSGTPMLGTKDPVVAFIAEQLDMLYGEGK